MLYASSSQFNPIHVRDQIKTPIEARVPCKVGTYASSCTPSRFIYQGECFRLFFFILLPHAAHLDHLMRIKLSSGEGRGRIGHTVHRRNEPERICRDMACGTHLSLGNNGKEYKTGPRSVITVSRHAFQKFQPTLRRFIFLLCFALPIPHERMFRGAEYFHRSRTRFVNDERARLLSRRGGNF